jgi:hypothetical protein
MLYRSDRLLADLGIVRRIDWRAAEPRSDRSRHAVIITSGTVGFWGTATHRVRITAIRDRHGPRRPSTVFEPHCCVRASTSTGPPRCSDLRWPERETGCALVLTLPARVESTGASTSARART